MTADTVPATSLVADAYQSVKAAIRDNVLAAGYQGSEQEIAARLGMSRTPVHEALIRLQAEGLVRILPKRGVVVCALSPDDMREVYDVVIALEGKAAELIAAMPDERRRPAVARLEALNTEMRRALRTGALEVWAAADDSFHRGLMVLCGNGRLAGMASTIMDQSHRARMLTLRLRAKPTRSIREHQAIIAAIERGDAVLAARAAEQHRRNARDELLPLLERLGMKSL